MKNNLQTWILVIIVLIVISIGIYLLISGGKTIKEGGNVSVSNVSNFTGGIGGNVSEGIGNASISNLTNESEGIGGNVSEGI